VYGFLEATVSRADAKEPVHFEFEEISEGALPPEVVSRFGAEATHRCFTDNAQSQP
jgi:hypothetical protein